MKGTWVQKPSNNITIIFIHGVLSGDSSCWTHANGTYWPKTLAENPDCHHLGIYSFEYKTGFFSGNYSLNDVVDALKEQLRLDGVTNSTALIFVCHSMGGIIARKYIVQNAAGIEREAKRIGLFLIASPSLGAEYANWLQPLAKFFKHSQASALRFAQDNVWLNGLDRDFINIKEGRHIEIRGKELVEDVFVVLPRFLLLNQVVAPISGAKYFGDAIKIPDSDHFSISKIQDNTDTKYRLLLDFISYYSPSAAASPSPTIDEKVVIKFSNEIDADLVSCQLQLENLIKNDALIEIIWPDETKNYEKQLIDVLGEAERYLKRDSIFFGEEPRQIADMASGIKSALRDMENLRQGALVRAPMLARSMIPYWTLSLESVIARSLANFITLVNFEIIAKAIYYFRHKALYEELFPKQYEYWFQVTKSTDRYSLIFPIKEEVCSVKISNISGVEIPFGAWFWGPKSEVLYSAKWKPGERIQGTWFDKYLIPQNELRLIAAPSDHIFLYDEKIDAIKVIDSRNNEIY